MTVMVFAAALSIAACGSYPTAGAAATTTASAPASGSADPSASPAHGKGQKSFNTDHPCAWLTKADLEKLGQTVVAPSRGQSGTSYDCEFGTTSFGASFDAQNSGLSQLTSIGGVITDVSINSRQGRQATSSDGRCTIAIPVTSSSRVDVQAIMNGTGGQTAGGTQACASALKLAKMIEPHLPPES